MATQTLAMAKLLINDEIVSGVAQDIIDVNPIFAALPFTGYEGQAIIVNRELTLGDASTYSIGGTITSKTAATFTRTTFAATKIIGDAEMDSLVQATSMGGGVDQLAIEISSKAKNVGRLFQLGMFTGTGSTPVMNSLPSLCAATQFTTASTTQTIEFALLDELLDLVKAKDGQVDFIIMPPRTMRSYRALLRDLGGTPGDWVMTMPDGRKVMGYEGIPIFKSDFCKIVETANGAAITGGALTSVWAGVWDDGSNKVGLAAIHPVSVPAGIVTEYIGKKTDKDEEIWRVKWYTNVALFNRKGLARLTSISD
jgi:hypothetical protein